MSEVKRYSAALTHSSKSPMYEMPDGEWIEAVPALAREAALREELLAQRLQLARCAEQIELQQQRLTAAEQRNTVYEELLHVCGLEFSTAEASAWEIAMRETINAVLIKPTESGASES